MMRYSSVIAALLPFTSTVLAAPQPVSGVQDEISKRLAGPQKTGSDVPYDQYITTCTVDNVVALTFDDGPYYYTSALLDLLKQHGAKATFFITGNNFNKGPINDTSSDWPALITRMHNEGHQIASHTWTHADLASLDEADREYELVTNEDALRNILGFTPTYMRPPYGSCSRDSGCLATATRLGYHVVTWDVDTKDFEDDLQRSKNLFDAGFDGSSSPIVLSHDTHEKTVADLAEYMLNRVEDANFKAVTVGECLGDPEEYWYTGADDGCPESSSPGNSNKAARADVSDSSKRLATSTDGTCGQRSDDKYTCEGSEYGDCCSYNGFCGATSGYCDGGCQADFGECNAPPCNAQPIVSENGLCGGNTFQTCAGSSYGDCCSAHGNCGRSDEYCAEDKGCQPSWGNCS